MSERLIIDTGPLVAWLDSDDQWHSQTARLSRQLRPPFLICEPVLTEVCFLLQRQPAAINQISAWLEIGYLQPAFSLNSHRERVFALIHKYNNLPMSLADACLVRMVEAGIGDRVFTLDEHFRLYRQSGRRVVPVLMPEQ